MQVTADDIAQLLASAPPRKVPARVRHAAHGGRREWLLPLFGLFFAAFGMVFVWLFFPWRLLDDWRLDSSGHNVPGKIQSVGETNMSINDERVIEYVFAYTPEGGGKRSATCYTTGKRWDEGVEVTVRYLPDRPEVARIDGGRLSRGGAAGMLVVLFPLVGGGVLIWFATDRVRTNRLLENGKVAEMDVLAVDATRMRVNYQTVYKITLSALPETGGEPVVVKRWGTAEVNLLTSHALEKQPIFVLYDPRRPKKLIFPETLIGH